MTLTPITACYLYSNYHQSRPCLRSFHWVFASIIWWNEERNVRKFFHGIICCGNQQLRLQSTERWTPVLWETQYKVKQNPTMTTLLETQMNTSIISTVLKLGMIVGSIKNYVNCTSVFCHRTDRAVNMLTRKEACLLNIAFSHSLMTFSHFRIIPWFDEQINAKLNQTWSCNKAEDILYTTDIVSGHHVVLIWQRDSLDFQLS